MFRKRPSTHNDQEDDVAYQETKVNELRTAIGPLSGDSLKYCTDACLRRYLKARNWNVAKATAMLKDTLKWRATYKPEEIHWNEIAHEGETGKAYRANFKDREGRTVLVLRPGKQNTKSHDNQLRHLVYLIENAIINLPEGQEQMMWLIDFSGWSITNSVPMKTAKETANILQNHYPERLASAFLYNPPRIFEAFWKEFNREPVIPIYNGRPDQAEKALKHVFNAAMSKLKGKELELLIAILPDNNGSLYGDLKRICETDLGLISQCCLTKYVFKISKQYLANVSLKINVKMGGRNTVLLDALRWKIPLVSDIPTIIFGADVTHPENGEESSPSIAAVVASQDWPEITKYAGLVCSQAHRQELIQDLYKTWHDPEKGQVTGGMIRELLISFRKATGQKPMRIIFYRDGVSEGQFYQVLLYELDAIRKACASLEPNYQPPVTFVIVQKRHHTRLYANNHKDRSSTDASGNILPGTVVDSKICHPNEFDFYLCSHAGIQGTSRPAHYHVLWDENNFSADEMQTLTNNLCYTYARCTRSVSVVPPAYYAHLAAFRARFYTEPEQAENRKSRNTGKGNNTSVKPLPALKEKVKRVMFYC